MKEICLVEKLLYDNSSPRPPEELNFENSDAVIESFSPSPIPISGKEGDILEELLNNDSLSLPENESIFHFHSIAPDYEASRARGFVLRSLELQSLA
ncbi:hypothetical protein Tco_1475159 [Tanacetum coccineum]